MSRIALIQPCRLWGRLAIAATLSVMGLWTVSLPSAAQTASDVDPLADFQIRDGDSDVFSGDSQQGIQNLIHQLRFASELSMDEFVNQRRENISSEADRFLQLQRDRLSDADARPSSQPTVDIIIDPALDL